MQTVIRCKIESALSAEYTWVLKVFGKFAGCRFEIVEENPQLLIAEHGLCDIQVSHFFRQTYQSGAYDHRSYFRKEPLHYLASGKPDYLSTCFYLLSYLQEYVDYVPDAYDRFPYQLSVQAAYQCTEQNLVAAYFRKLHASTPVLQQLVALPTNNSAFFLSHDIDTVYGAMRGNAAYLLKKGRVGTLLQLILHHYFGTPDQLLLEKIMDMEDAHDVRSVFFWLVNSGRGTRKINNADYLITNKTVQSKLRLIRSRGFVNGLHKSAGRDTYASELERLGREGSPVNRNHYLLCSLPDTFDALEKAGIQMDCTLGFADAMGFRNSYGLPVAPFHMRDKRSYRFLEVPLTVMDTTLRYYNKLGSKEAGLHLIDFLERNRTDALISVLWHNNYFFDHAEPGWIGVYKEVLQFIHLYGMQAMLPQEILERYA